MACRQSSRRLHRMFLSANFVNGLFSGIRGVISAYLQVREKLHPLAEAS